MKARKVILTLEILTDIPKNVFNKLDLQNLFDRFGFNEEVSTELDINRVTFRVVKEDK